MTLTQAAQLAVVANASISLTVAVPALVRTLAQLGAQLRGAVRRRPKQARLGSAQTRKGP